VDLVIILIGLPLWFLAECHFLRRDHGKFPVANFLATLQGHTDRVSNAVFSPDGQRTVTASRHNTARVFRVVNSATSESVLAK